MNTLEQMYPPPLLAERALGLLWEYIKQPVNTDTTTERAPQKIGDTITLRNPHAPSPVPVCLDSHADITFPVTWEDLRHPIDEFTRDLIAPAMMTLAEQIDWHLTNSGSPDPIFGSAPLEILPDASGKPTPFAAVESRDGIWLRAMYMYDITRHETLACFDILYGVVVPEDVRAAAAAVPAA